MNSYLIIRFTAFLMANTLSYSFLDFELFHKIFMVLLILLIADLIVRLIIFKKRFNFTGERFAIEKIIQNKALLTMDFLVLLVSGILLPQAFFKNSEPWLGILSILIAVAPITLLATLVYSKRIRK